MQMVCLYGGVAFLCSLSMLVTAPIMCVAAWLYAAMYVCNWTCWSISTIIKLVYCVSEGILPLAPPSRPRYCTSIEQHNNDVSESSTVVEDSGTSSQCNFCLQEVELDVWDMHIVGLLEEGIPVNICVSTPLKQLAAARKARKSNDLQLQQ